MQTKARLEKLANTVVNNGLHTNSLQAELSKVASRHDLNDYEVARVAEFTNRQAQMTMQKQASDKRATFTLAEPGAVKTSAALFTSPSATQEKVAALALDGDGYNIPRPLNISSLSVFNTPINPDVILDEKRAQFNSAIREIEKQGEYYRTLHDAAEEEKAKSKNRLTTTYKDTVDAAADMVLTGVTLPDMYLTITAAVNGCDATQEDKDNAEKLALSIIKELKKRGISNHRMGFRTQKQKADFDKLSAEELYALCKNCMGAEKHPAKKYAEFESKVKKNGGPLALLEEAAEHLTKHKPGVNDGHIYMDDARNYEKDGNPPIVNADSTFYIKVTDLVSEQARLTKLHCSADYIGTRLKEIEEAVKSLRSGETKTALVPAAMAAAIGGVGGTAGATAAGTAATGLGSAAVGNAVGIAGVGAQVAGMVQQRNAERRQEKAKAAPPDLGLSRGGGRTVVAEYTGEKVAAEQPSFFGKAWNTLNSNAFTNLTAIGTTGINVGSQIYGQNRNVADQRRLARQQHAYNIAEQRGVYIKPDGTTDEPADPRITPLPQLPGTGTNTGEMTRVAGAFL